MRRGDIEFKNKFIALILLIADNNCKIEFYLLLSILLYTQLLCI